MCIIRVAKNHDNKFAQVDKRYLESKQLSLKAKGLLTYLLSKPNNWQIKFGDLIQNNADGEWAIRRAINELIANGYMQKQVTRKNGRFHTDYTVYEVAQQEEEQDESKNRQKEDKNQQNRTEEVACSKKAETRPRVAEKISSNTQVWRVNRDWGQNGQKKWQICH